MTKKEKCFENYWALIQKEKVIKLDSAWLQHVKETNC